jgi:hypothetical protein
MPVTVPSAPVVKPALTTPVPASSLADQAARLASYGVDFVCGLDPYNAGWKMPDGSQRYVRWPVGTWVTPRRDSALADIGVPHLVIFAMQLSVDLAQPLFTGTRLDGAMRDMRVVKLVSANNLLGPQAFWVESIDFEPYTPPAGVTMPDVRGMLAPFVAAGSAAARLAVPAAQPGGAAAA